MPDSPTQSPAHTGQGLPSSLLGAMCDASPLPMWIYDAQTLRVLAVNGRALDYFDCRRDQFSALPLLSAPAVAPADEGGSVLGHHRKADGTIIAMRIETNRVEVEGRPAGLVVAIDMTAESRALGDSDARYRELLDAAAGTVTAQVEADKALRERDRRFRQLFETASDWFWEGTIGGRITYVSPNFEALYGIPVAELLGRRLIEHPSVKIDPEMGQKAIAAIKAREPLRDIVYSHEFADGRVIWVKTSAVPLFDAEGKFTGYWGVSKDVTTEIEAERTLRDSERHFKQVLEASADYYWEQDAQYRFTHLAPSNETLFGIPGPEVIGKRLSDIPAVSIDPELAKMALTAHKAKQPYRDFIYACKTPDGKKRWYKVSGAAIIDRSGKFGGYRGVGAEITRQVEVATAARLAEQRLNEAVAHVSQPIVVYDAEDRVVAHNQAFTDLHQAPNTNTQVCQGASFRELAEWQLRFGFFGDGPDDGVVDLDTLLARHQTEAEHTYHLHDDRWMLVVYRRLPGEGTVGLWTDVTALKRAEAERRALERQIHHSQRLEAVGTLAGGIAHEINNALVPVIALTKLMAKKLPEESRERRNLGAVLIGAERSRDLVKQILAFSRKEEERPRENVDIDAVLREALRLMRATLPTSIRIEEEFQRVPAIVGDSSQLHQVIVNIMTNAAQAIGETQGSITVSLRPETVGDHLCLAIADTGCGMSEATLARVFEPFFTTKPVGEGTGLGLSVAHGIIKDHGGRIEVTSAPGRGTRFAIVLPVHAASSGQAA
jgi:PAS domain S-box-containing protein